MTMRSSSVAAVAALCTFTVAQAQQPLAPRHAYPQPLAAVQATSAGVEFMLQAGHSNLAEIAAGELALQRADDLAVRQYATRLVQDHRAMQAKLQEMAQARGVALPPLPSRQQRYVLDALQGLRGQQFEMEFLRRIGIEAHREAVALHRRGATETAIDEGLRQYALNALPMLQVHMDLAQTVFALALRQERRLS